MIFKGTNCWIALLIISASSIFMCDTGIPPIPVDKDIQIIGNVLHDIINEFAVRQDIRLITFIFQIIPDFSFDILKYFVAKIDDKIHYKFENLKSYYQLFQPKILLFKTLEEFKNLEKFHPIVGIDDVPLMFFVFIQNLTFETLKSSGIFYKYKSVTVLSRSIFQYSFFITNEKDTTTFSTVEWFSHTACNQPYLKKLNTFNKKSMKWDSNLKFYEKFMDFYGCELVLMLPAHLAENDTKHRSIYSIINAEPCMDYEIHGIGPIIFDAASKSHNFSVAYQPAYTDMYWLLKTPRLAKIIYVNRTFKIPTVFFEIRQLEAITYYLKASNAIRTTKIYVFVTPSEEYSMYKKFFMAFSPGSWILLSTIFFFYVLLISRSRLVQLFQKKQKIGIFGIFQPKLPYKNFIAIFILIYFILQICFQSKLFESMQKVAKTSLVRTIDDLIDSGYTVYATNYTAGLANGVFNEERRYADLLFGLKAILLHTLST